MSNSTALFSFFLLNEFLKIIALFVALIVLIIYNFTWKIEMGYLWVRLSSVVIKV